MRELTDHCSRVGGKVHQETLLKTSLKWKNKQTNKNFDYLFLYI